MNFKSAKEIVKDLGEWETVNNIIEKIDIGSIGHFGGLISLRIVCKDIILGGYNNTQNLGYAVKILFELFETKDDDFTSVQALKNVPIRIIFEPNEMGQAYAVGHFMNDKFIKIDDLFGAGGSKSEQSRISPTGESSS